VAARGVDDELLYREGLRLGVDKNDSIVRARVVEKMLFLAEDLGGAARPVSDDELARYLAAHGDAFRRPTRVSFVHVFAAGDAALLTRLRPTLSSGSDGEAAEPPAVGDAFPIGRRVVDSPLELVTRSYGRALAEAVAALPVGEWSAPLRSPFGWHLVKVVARRGGGVPTLDEVRGEVRLAYLAERKQRATADFMRQLHARYHVTIDDADDASPIAAGAAPLREAD
jgi:peptidyl-prolyl cis-trans isomerase C